MHQEPTSPTALPVPWSRVDRALLLAAVGLPCAAAYLWRIHFLIAHPEVEPYFDRAALSWAGHWLRVAVLLSSALLALGLRLRRTRPQSNAFAFAVNLLWWAVIAAMTYALGPATSPVLMLYLAGIAVNFLLFEGPALYVPLALALAARMMPAAAVLSGALRYAPLFAKNPIEAQGLDSVYLTVTLLATTLLLFFMMAIFALFRAAQQREARRTAEHYAAATRLEAALASSLDAILSVDAAGTVTSWNKGAEALTGYTRAEALGKTPLFFSPPEELRYHAGLLAKLLAGEAVSGISTLARRKDGATREILGSGMPVRAEDGRLAGISFILRDITDSNRVLREQVALREHLEFLVSANPAVIYTCAPSGDYAVTFVSDNVRSLLGYAPGDFLREPGFWAARIHPEDRERLFQELAVNLEPQGRHTHEYRFRAADGTWRWILDELKVLRDTNGTPREIIGFRLDVTEQKEAQEAVRRSRNELEVRVQERTAELEHANERLRAAEKMRAVGELASGIAHDFNNILANIGSQLNLLRMQAEEKPQTEGIFKNLSLAVLRGGRTASQLLELARPGHSAAHPTRLHRAIARAAEALLQGRGPEVSIAQDLAAKSDRISLGETQVESVLANLLSNARQAVSGGGRIRIATRNVEAARASGGPARVQGKFLELTVQDNGRGISPADLPRIFEPFFTTRGKSGGHGLGLFGVYNQVRAAGGSVSVESAPGKGATFTALLPLAPEEAAAGAPPPPPPAPAAAQAQGARKRRALIVDDESMLRDAMAQVLARLGYETRQAADGAEGLQLIRAHSDDPFDVVFVDRIMPVLGGREMLETLSPLQGPTRYVVISGNVSPSESEELLAMGAAKVLLKPFPLGVLKDLLARLMGE